MLTCSRERMAHDRVYVLWNINDINICYIAQSMYMFTRELGSNASMLYGTGRHKDWRVRKIDIGDVLGLNQFRAEFTTVILLQQDLSCWWFA